MNFNDVQPYVIPALFVGYLVWKQVRFRKVKSGLPAAKAKGAVVVDVRSPGEYKRGSSAGSLNIPLNDLEKRLSELDPEKPVIVCCASGTRSGMAAGILKRHGFKNVVNAGPWTNTMSA